MSGRARARSFQLAVELVEVLPDTSAGGDHDAVAREGGSLSERRHDPVVVAELERGMRFAAIPSTRSV